MVSYSHAIQDDRVGVGYDTGIVPYDQKIIFRALTYDITISMKETSVS